MLLRLLIVFVAFAVLTSALVAIVLVQRTGASGPASVLVIILVAGLIMVGPAWVFARSFVRPFREMREGAERIARGEYGHRVQGGVWRESHELARSFNEMSARLAAQIDRLEAERGQLRAILGGMVEGVVARSEEHTSELQSLRHLVCRLLLEKKKHESRRFRFTQEIHHIRRDEAD